MKKQYFSRIKIIATTGVKEIRRGYLSQEGDRLVIEKNRMFRRKKKYFVPNDATLEATE